VTGRSIALFIVAAAAEIGGAYLMWQAVKEGRGLLFALAGAVALAGYGAVAALQPDANSGRVLAAYGGVFIIAHCSGAWPSTASAPTYTT
jgi:small multidrug resistance family-3 protein